MTQVTMTQPEVDRVDARRPRTRRRSWGDALLSNLNGWGFVLPAMVIVVGLAVFPAGWAFLISRQKANLISPATDVDWANYQRMLDDPGLAGAVGHTAFFAALYVPISIVAGMLIAVALNREIRFQWFYRTCIFVPFVASAAATGILANFVFDPDFGVANNVLRVLHLPEQGWLTDRTEAMLVLVLISLWGSIGFNVVVYLAALQDVSKDLIESAMLDGANGLRTFRHVVMPSLRPVTVFMAVWQTIAALQLFDLVYTTTRGQPVDSTVTIVYYLYRQAFELFHYGYGSAIAYGVFAITMLLTITMVLYARRAKVEAF